MHSLDPAAPEEPPTGADTVTEASLYEQEVELAQSAPSVDVLEPAPTPSASDLDPALRLQDAPANWAGAGDVGPVGEPAPEADPGNPAAEPYAPLADSGRQGI